MKVTINNKALAIALGFTVSPDKPVVVDVECKNGIPIDREWRNRFKDAEIDGCISVAKPKPKKEAN